MSEHRKLRLYDPQNRKRGTLPTEPKVWYALEVQNVLRKHRSLRLRR